MPDPNPKDAQKLDYMHESISDGALNLEHLQQYEELTRYNAQADRTDRQQDCVDKQYDRTDRQNDRLDAILTKWKEQQRKIDALQERFERRS